MSLIVHPFLLVLPPPQRNMTALHIAVQHGFEREVKLLVEAGVSVDSVDAVSTVPALTRLEFPNTVLGSVG